MPAASAVSRCAASNPSENQSQGPAGRSSVPVPKPGLPTNAAFHCRGRHCQVLHEIPVAISAAHSGLLPTQRATSAIEAIGMASYPTKSLLRNFEMEPAIEICRLFEPHPETIVCSTARVTPSTARVTPSALETALCGLKQGPKSQIVVTAFVFEGRQQQMQMA